MEIFNSFLNWLDSKGRKRVVMDREGKDPYLERYYIFLKDREHFPFNIFLHKFLKSDPDDLHDHPWPYATFILKGGYWEWVPVYKTVPMFGPFKFKTTRIVGERRIWRGPGHFRVNRATSYHRIELDPNIKECWTLFMPGKRWREWGFLMHKNWSNFKWIYNEEYINKKTVDAMK